MATTTESSTRPWVERYRPKTLQDVSHQQEVVATLQNAVETGRLPHLLLYGPPGSGKVRTAKANKTKQK
jgi:replication factor C subunit 2/4